MTDSQLPDVQAEPMPPDTLAIQQVGIASLRQRLSVARIDGGVVCTVADVSLTVSLPREVRGTHMSRFVRELSDPSLRDGHGFTLRVGETQAFLARLAESLGAPSVSVRFAFPMFVRRSAPVSAVGAEHSYDCELIACYDGQNGKYKYSEYVGVHPQIATLCPCSKEISEYGAHNQRSRVGLLLHCPTPDLQTVFFEAALAACEQAASTLLYPALKRPDEKYVTERAYENPKFVEDVVRGVAVEVQERFLASGAADWAEITAVNEESIHTHNACARVELGDRPHTSRQFGWMR